MFTQIPDSEIRRFVYDALIAADVDEQVANDTAHALWLTSLRGIDSHGIRLLPHYVAAIEAGRLNPKPNLQFNQTALATGVLNADHTLGHAASAAAMRHAINLARDAGMAAVVVKNSSHNGSLACYGLKAAQQDMIGFVMTIASPSVKSPNGIRPFFGTNPICITAPMLNEDPFCFDAATTQMTINKVRQYREDSKPLPAGIAADQAGQPTTDPEKVFQLLPIGDYKGFGIMMMADILSNMLAGMPSGNQVTKMYATPLSEKRYLAHFCMAIRIDAFRNLQQFKQDLQATADKIRSEPRLNEDVPVMVPGDPEKAIARHRTGHGIPVKPLDMERLADVASKRHITPLQTM